MTTKALKLPSMQRVKWYEMLNVFVVVYFSGCDKNSARRPGPNGEGGEEAR